MTILVTGAAGFIGSHVAHRLLQDGHKVIGIDNLNNYYDPALKQARLTRLTPNQHFTFKKIDIADRHDMADLFASVQPKRVVHLAAQAGVRYSIENPHAYAESNLIGFLNILEGCRQNACEHLAYASTSSVYGLNTAMPFSEHQPADHPMTFYAATKRANELMAHSYSHLYKIPTTGLRFFTVYGPWGRPDMALFKFAKAIISGESMDVYNHGKMVRDFTYIDDIVEGIVRILGKPACADPTWSPAEPDPASSSAPWRVYNIGNNKPVQLMDYIRAAEKALGRSAKINFLPMQPGDVPATQADVTALAATTGFTPQVTVEDGVARFIAWYREYHHKPTIFVPV